MHWPLYKRGDKMSESAQQLQRIDYRHLCELLDIKPVQGFMPLAASQNQEMVLAGHKDERLTCALNVLFDCLVEEDFDEPIVDTHLLDGLIYRIDTLLSQQVDEILHHPQFQQLESLWRSISYLIKQTDFSANIKFDILDVSQQELVSDFSKVSDLSQSVLYRHIYTEEYDTPGGEPMTAMIAPYEFATSNQDIGLLRNIAKVAQKAHCPFLASVGPRFFNKKNMADVLAIEDVKLYLEQAEYIPWHGLRQSEAARYLGLVMPKVLLRLPYDVDDDHGFLYQESVEANEEAGYLWGSGVYMLAANMVRSFKEHGWCVNIRGPLGGGKVVDLPLYFYDIGRGFEIRSPTEVTFSETEEYQLSELGFIPLCYYKNTDTACFYSVNSIQKPQKFSSLSASANSRVNARLPYIFLSARLAHYLKVLQRENIGSSKNRQALEEELNHWLNTLVTKMNAPPADVAARYPLAEGRVEVLTVDDNPGFYRVNLYAKPHFQVEGMDVNLSLVSALPINNGN